MKKVLYAHPDNIKKLLDQMRWPDVGVSSLFSSLDACIELTLRTEFEIKPDPRLPVDEPTGRYVMPGGKAVDREAIHVSERFCDYGPEDLDWLLAAGVIREERRLVFYVADFDKFGFLNLAAKAAKSTTFMRDRPY